MSIKVPPKPKYPNGLEVCPIPGKSDFRSVHQLYLPIDRQFTVMASFFSREVGLFNYTCRHKSTGLFASFYEDEIEPALFSSPINLPPLTLFTIRDLQAYLSSFPPSTKLYHIETSYAYVEDGQDPIDYEEPGVCPIVKVAPDSTYIIL